MPNNKTTRYLNADGEWVTRIANDVPDEVRFTSAFGCRNCLYYGCECRSGSRYAPETADDGSPSCAGYAYCD